MDYQLFFKKKIPSSDVEEVVGLWRRDRPWLHTTMERTGMQELKYRLDGWSAMPLFFNLDQVWLQPVGDSFLFIKIRHIT